MGSSLGCAQGSDALPRNAVTPRRTNGGAVKCRRHLNNNVTHYDRAANDLICLTCFQNMKRSKHGDIKHVEEIKNYTCSIEFKQRTTQVEEKARSIERRCEKAAKHYQQTAENIEKRREELLDEVQTYIRSLIGLLDHLKDELCREINTESDRAATMAREKTQTLENETARLKQIRFANAKSERGVSENLQNTIELEKNTYKINNDTQQFKDFIPRLRLNRTLSLAEVMGNLQGTKRIKLGKFSIEQNPIPAPAGLMETLDDITEDSSENNTRTNSLESTPSTTPVPSTSSKTSTFQRSIVGKRVGTNARILPVHSPLPDEPNTPTNTEESDLNDVIGSINLDSQTSKSVKITGAQNLNLNLPFHDSLETPKPKSRRVSFSRSPSRQATDTPRKSVQSILSPGKLDTPAFVTPTPRTGRLANIETGMVRLVKTISLPKEDYLQNITSSVMLDDGRIVLCDQQNAIISLFNDKFNRIDEVRLNACPHNIAHVPDFGIAATIPDDESIQFVQIKGEYFAKRIENIKSKPQCRGIEFIDGNLLYTTGNDVAVLKKTDPKQRTWKFKFAFRKPMSLYVDGTTRSMFVTCYGMKDTRGEVVKMNFHKQSVEFVASLREISRPVCSAIDRHGYIYVCDVKPHGVHQISPDGQYVRKLLGENDGKFQHINFVPHSDMFIVTENNCDKIKLYRLE